MTIKIWQSESPYNCITTLEGHLDIVISLAILPNSNHIVSGSFDTTIKIWPLKIGGNATYTLSQHTGAVYCLAKLLNGNLASGSWDNQVIIWDATNSFSMSLKLLYFFSIRLIHVKLKKKVYHKFLRHILILYGQ
jgi:COMPASS component SWD3